MGYREKSCDVVESFGFNGTNSAHCLFLAQPLSGTYNMTSRTERFERKSREKEDEVPEEPEEVIRFPPEKEAVSRSKAGGFSSIANPVFSYSSKSQMHRKQLQTNCLRRHYSKML